jgi:hypothetical protein
MPSILWVEPVIAHRPPIIRSFLRDLAKSNFMLALPDNCQRVLFYLSSLAEKDGSDKPVTPAKQTIANVTGLSLPSIYRSLNRLEADCLISRGEQKLEGTGYNTRFGNTPIFLGCKILDILRNVLNTKKNSDQSTATSAPIVEQVAIFEEVISKMDEPIIPSSQISVVSGPPITEFIAKADEILLPAYSINADARIYADIQADAKHDQEKTLKPLPTINLIVSKEETVVDTKESKGASSQIRIPEDLRHLQDKHGMSGQDIVGLLSMAKRFGKRLQDVLIAKKAVIESGGIKNLWGYLAHLLSCNDTDFAWIVKEKTADQKEQIEADERKAKVEQMSADLAGKTISASDGTRYEVTPNGRFVYVVAAGKSQGCAPIGLMVNTLEAALRNQAEADQPVRAQPAKAKRAPLSELLGALR